MKLTECKADMSCSWRAASQHNKSTREPTKLILTCTGDIVQELVNDKCNDNLVSRQDTVGIIIVR